MAALSPADAAYMSAVVLAAGRRAGGSCWTPTARWLCNGISPRMTRTAPRCFFHLTMPGVRYVPWHDHGFDNTSVVISRGYDELWRPSYWCDDKPIVRRFRKGDMIFRDAQEAHRLVLPPDISTQ
jgi:hypothetical protein